MNKEGLIDSISRKLCSGVKLETSEIEMVVRALKESNNYLQKPYYEVIYHDEYDNVEHRIMEPISSREYKDYPNCKIREDHFDLRFRRLVKGDEE